MQSSGRPRSGVIRVIDGSWGGVIEARSVGVVEVVEQIREEICAVGLLAFDGVVALAGQDRDELGSGVEEAAAFADRFVGAVESSAAGRLQRPLPRWRWWSLATLAMISPEGSGVS